MGKLSFSESVRVWIGEVAFDIFLWSVRMSADDYFDMLLSEGGLTPRAPESPYVCMHCGAHVSSEHLPWCKSLTREAEGWECAECGVTNYQLDVNVCQNCLADRCE